MITEADTDKMLWQHATKMLTNLLDAVKPALLVADCKWQQFAATEAPSFRALSLVSPDENCLSDIIAELLDPHGSHGQGTTFLKLFLSRCGPVGRFPENQVRVHRESSTISIANQKRRIDILIDGVNWGIGIENKAWADEQENQFQDYAEDLENRFGENFLLIRLTGRDTDVASIDAARLEQLMAQSRFASWHFDAKLLDWVKECQQYSQSPRVKAFLEDFSRYITAEFAIVTNLRTDMERKYLLPALESILEKDPSHFYSVATIVEIFPELRRKFIATLFGEIQKDILEVLGSGWIAELDEENFVETDWAGFVCSHKDWRELYYVKLESQPKFGLVVLGIWHDADKGIIRNAQIAQDLKRLRWGKKSGGRCWEGQSDLPEPFTNWATPSGLAALVEQRKELKKLLTDEFVKLCTHFKSPLTKLAKAAAHN